MDDPIYYIMTGRGLAQLYPQQSLQKNPQTKLIALTLLHFRAYNLGEDIHLEEQTGALPAKEPG